MLVLSRRVGDSVVIGDDVVVTVLEVRGDVVRVGVDAPREVAVRRQELLAELADSNRAAAAPNPAAVSDLSRLVRNRRPTDRPTDRRSDSPSSSSTDPRD
jgi:carbon storage regulator